MSVAKAVGLYSGVTRQPRLIVPALEAAVEQCQLYAITRRPKLAVRVTRLLDGVLDFDVRSRL